MWTNWIVMNLVVSIASIHDPKERPGRSGCHWRPISLKKFGTTPENDCAAKQPSKSNRNRSAERPVQWTVHDWGDRKRQTEPCLNHRRVAIQLQGCPINTLCAKGGLDFTRPLATANSSQEECVRGCEQQDSLSVQLLDHARLWLSWITHDHTILWRDAFFWILMWSFPNSGASGSTMPTRKLRTLHAMEFHMVWHEPGTDVSKSQSKVLGETWDSPHSLACKTICCPRTYFVKTASKAKAKPKSEPKGPESWKLR